MMMLVQMMKVEEEVDEETEATDDGEPDEGTDDQADDTTGAAAMRQTLTLGTRNRTQRVCLNESASIDSTSFIT